MSPYRPLAGGQGPRRIRGALRGLARDVVAVVMFGIAFVFGGCVLALSGADAERLRQIQTNAVLVYDDDAQTPAAHQVARADYCLARAALVDNGEAPIDAGPGKACEPEGGR